MASQADLEFTYTLIDKLFRLSLGEMADFSGAKYDGDFTLSLEQAQHRKHTFVTDSLRLEAGQRALDLGCGWGPMLKHFRTLGVSGLGVTLSSAQAAACRRNGLDVLIMDARAIGPDNVGRFDAVASLGAFEHFCSLEEYQAGRQESIYRSLFERVASVLPGKGRFFLQTMVFGPNMIPADQVSVAAPPHSDAWYLGLMHHQFPGSWLPYGLEQLARCASPSFQMISHSSGRLDYIETIRQWRTRFAHASPRKLLLKLQLLPRYLASADFRLAFTSGVSANTVCFERLLMDHYRIVFEKA